MHNVLPQTQSYYHCFNLRAKTPDGRRRLSAFSVYPTAEYTLGAAEVFVAIQNTADLFALDVPTVKVTVEALSEVAQPLRTTWEGWAKFEVRTREEAAEIVRRFRALVGSVVNE